MTTIATWAAETFDGPSVVPDCPCPACWHRSRREVEGATPPGTYAERVRRGAALLDERVPGWEALLDLAELDLASWQTCVVGQLNRTRNVGLFDPNSVRTYALRAGGVTHHGFDLSWNDDVDPVDAPRSRVEFAKLTDEWRAEVTRRRLERVPA